MIATAAAAVAAAAAAIRGRRDDHRKNNPHGPQQRASQLQQHQRQSRSFIIAHARDGTWFSIAIEHAMVSETRHACLKTAKGPSVWSHAQHACRKGGQKLQYEYVDE